MRERLLTLGNTQDAEGSRENMVKGPKEDSVMDVRIAGHGSLPCVVHLGRTWRRRRGRTVPLVDDRALNIVSVLVVYSRRDDALLLEDPTVSGATVLESGLCCLNEVLLFQHYLDIGLSSPTQICDLVEISIFCDGESVPFLVDGRSRSAGDLARSPDFPLLLI